MEEEKEEEKLGALFFYHDYMTEVANKSTCNIIEAVLHEEDNEVPCQVFKGSKWVHDFHLIRDVSFTHL